MGLYTAIGIVIAIIVIASYFLINQEGRLDRLTQHDVILKGIEESENDVVKGLQGSFDITSARMVDGSYNIDETIKLLKFRFQHLYALSQIKELPEGYVGESRHYKMIKMKYKNIIEAYERYNQLLKQYTEKYGTIDRNSP